MRLRTRQVAALLLVAAGDDPRDKDPRLGVAQLETLVQAGLVIEGTEQLYLTTLGDKLVGLVLGVCEVALWGRR